MSKSIEFLQSLAEKLRTQDNLCTASPNYTIQEEHIVSGLDLDYFPEVGWFHSDGDGYPAEGEEAKQLEAEYEKTGNEPTDWNRTGYIKSWEYTGMAFLTKAAADAYVAQCAYRHRRPIRVYVDSHYRNPEMKEVRRLLAGPVQECINALRLCLPELAAWMKDHGEDIKSQEALEVGCAALDALDTAREPHQ